MDEAVRREDEGGEGKRGDAGRRGGGQGKSVVVWQFAFASLEKKRQDLGSKTVNHPEHG